MSEENNSLVKSVFATYKIPLIAITIGIVLVIGIAYAAYQPSKDYVVGLINNFVQQQRELIVKDYQDELKKQQEEIEILKQQIANSDKKISQIRKKVGIIENDMANTPIPTSSEEMRNRFDKLGYKPIN